MARSAMYKMSGQLRLWVYLEPDLQVPTGELEPYHCLTPCSDSHTPVDDNLASPFLGLFWGLRTSIAVKVLCAGDHVNVCLAKVILSIWRVSVVWSWKKAWNLSKIIKGSAVLLHECSEWVWTHSFPSLVDRMTECVKYILQVKVHMCDSTGSEVQCQNTWWGCIHVMIYVQNSMYRSAGCVVWHLFGNVSNLRLQSLFRYNYINIGSRYQLAHTQIWLMCQAHIRLDPKPQLLISIYLARLHETSSH